MQKDVVFGTPFYPSKCRACVIDTSVCRVLMQFVVHSNNGVQDFAAYNWGASRDFDDCANYGGVLPAVCETEVSPLCPYGWAYYADADGSEGTDSCLYISPSTVTSWSAANSSCPAGSHLLTVKSASSTSGLLPFATSLYHGSGEKVYIGCRCV